ncbi:3-deoxy-8-phosphooctulonate synthase [Deferribacter desulfuricans SSM1]|uniref:3-deoxy-8-phosphooctulonate synthase n=1 Tax=Deferribacter desulfuricans (strain DSM 14783 / JCM 11476 / NBRC 101012 / SSM1) TaxID=639282 RepID=D3PD35_DEFDS|nr:3-deoxy-8-phosphooctulonate synthase [Deferribacter desulfuricans]BAI80508.1 3-deoxy-8-phosphooctulonate synthase [Deferribacter desulfuricans SSM1]
MLIIAGPCVYENDNIAFKTCEFLKKLCEKYGFEYVYKTSYDKANRSSVHSYRGPGIEKGVEFFIKLKEKFGVKILTDFHSEKEADIIKDYVDILQVPAFLCRQTDILKAAAKSGKIVNVKKGQFMAPWDMKNVVEKLTYFGAKEIMITERGYSFGYNNLVVDYRSFPIMKEFCDNIIFDVTHSVQLPGGKGFASSGERRFAPYLARAAVACGVDGLFMEIHPDPDSALCDGANMLDFQMTEKLFDEIKRIWDTLWM